MSSLRLPLFERLVLATAVLLAGTSTPGIRHAHAGGAAAHRHHHGSHAHGHSHAATDDPPAEPMGLNDCVCHLHFSCLGFALTMPIEPGNEESSSHPTLTPEQVVASAVKVDSPQLNGPAMPLEIATVPCTGNVLSKPRHPAVQREKLALKHSLCDRARHERSGVQLS